MPITLELSDDVAIDIISQLSLQISQKLTTKNEPLPPISANDEAAAQQKARAEILTYSPGFVFRNIDVQIKTGTNVEVVSKALKRLAREGKAHMLHRGTWKISDLSAA